MNFPDFSPAHANAPMSKGGARIFNIGIIGFFALLMDLGLSKF
jgi:hypothetical protein